MNWSHLARIIDAEKEIAFKATMRLLEEERLPHQPGMDWVSREVTCRRTVDMAARHWAAKRQYPLSRAATQRLEPATTRSPKRRRR